MLIKVVIEYQGKVGKDTASTVGRRIITPGGHAILKKKSVVVNHTYAAQMHHDIKKTP